MYMNMCEYSDFLHITEDGTARRQIKTVCFQQMLINEWAYNTSGSKSYFTKIWSIWIKSLFSGWGLMHFSYCFK